MHPQAGGEALSNAGIIDMGDRTLVVDSCETLVAGLLLRLTGEAKKGTSFEEAIRSV